MKMLFLKSYRYMYRVALPLLCLIVLSVSIDPCRAVAAPPNGVIRQVGNQQVLNLWGTNYEMGYAHGYLLADKIRDLIDHFMIGKVCGGSLSAYNTLLAKDAAQFQWQQIYLDEIKGITDGMAASGKSLYVSKLGRNIDSRDIRALNLQEQFTFGCSSFGIWGNATANGETILARNNDWYWDPEGNNANYQMVIAYEPTNKTKFISFAWPGSVGVYSGMNEYGVTVMANTGNLTNTYSGPYHPVVDVYRTILETTTTYNFVTQPLTAITSVHEDPSEIIQLGTSLQGNGYPVYYIEQSPDRDVIRFPEGNNNYVIAANHFLSVAATPSNESLNRYNTMKNGLLSLMGNGGKVDSTEAFGILRSVANSVGPTLTSIVIRPNRMEFDLSFAKVVNGVFTDATAFQPQTYTWASLFPDSGLLALNDGYNTTTNTVLSQASPGVLSNDTGSEGVSLTAQLVSSPSHGTLTLNPNGSFDYTPVANYVGNDSFTYRASDGSANSNIATVTIAVTSTNNVLFSDEFTRVPGAPNLLSPWVQALGTWTVADGVLQGSGSTSAYSYVYVASSPLWSNYTVEGRVKFPAGAFGGGIGGRVNPTNGAHYGAWVFPDGSIAGSNTLSLSKFRDWTTWSGTEMSNVSLPSVGTGWHALKVIFNGARIQVYYDGTLMIDVTDNNFDSLPAYLTGGISGDMWTYTSPYVMQLDNVVVSTPAINVSPVAVNDTYSTNANTVLNQAAPGVLNNDTDPQGTTLTAILVAGPSHGTLTLNSIGSFIYTPTANYAGSDSFTYMANDGTSSSNVATVTITVVPALALSSLSVSPISVTGGATSQGTVKLSAPAPSGGIVVALSDNSSAVGVPYNVTVAGGNTSATFTISTTAVASSTSATISATYAGVTKTAPLTVVRPVLKAFSVSPASVTGGTTSQGTVTLSGPAPSGGVMVSLSDNSSAAAVPASVTVASGSTSATFTITTYRVTNTRPVTISASSGGVTITATLMVRRR